MSEKEDRMGRAEAMGILARMATQRGRTLDEVRALQVAVRAVAKRLFDAERCFKRRREEGRTETPRQDGDAKLATAAEAAGTTEARLARIEKFIDEFAPNAIRTISCLKALAETVETRLSLLEAKGGAE